MCLCASCCVKWQGFTLAEASIPRTTHLGHVKQRENIVHAPFTQLQLTAQQVAVRTHFPRLPERECKAAPIDSPCIAAGMPFATMPCFCGCGACATQVRMGAMCASLLRMQLRTGALRQCPLAQAMPSPANLAAGLPGCNTLCSSRLPSEPHKPTTWSGTAMRLAWTAQTAASLNSLQMSRGLGATPQLLAIPLGTPLLMSLQVM